MSYCVNPACPHPENPDRANRCQACASKLLLHDRYRVIKALGQGGFGATFVAVDDPLPGKPICVIKQLRPASTAPHVLEMARQLFDREAKTLGKIGNHPQVPRLLDYFESEKQFYLVQEYVSGPTLKQEVKRNGPFTEFGVKQFLREILPLVKYLHENEVIHRDIKPANILRRDVDNKLVLIDFGAVKDQVQTALVTPSSTGHTAFTSFAIGTPGFAPQEQMALRPVYASDIYAVGATCLYLLTGKSPKHIDYDPMTAELLWRPHVYISDSFAEVLGKMLAASVRDRYQTAEEVFRALDVESHIDSLSEGLATQGKGASRQAEEDTHLERNNSAWLSPAAREVELLRARRANKKAKASNQGATTLTRSLTSSPTSATSFRTQTLASPASNPDSKYDANGVRLAYGKGRRDFGDCDLIGLDLAKANLSGANFYDAEMDRINLQGSNLFNANFGRASLVNACLRDAHLGKAYFVNANLEGADLRGADLSYASLSQANLRGANLCGANLTGARVTERQLSMARTNWLTIKPNGKRGIF